MGKTLKLIISIVFCLGFGTLGAFVTNPAIPKWYVYLNKPFFNPPNWLFGPVWTILYILMGISLFLIWNKGIDKKGVKNALKVFMVQFALNLIWSPVFFGFKNLFLAFLIIICLWISVLTTIKSFSKLNKTSAYLLYPYFAWISFASILNFSVWLLNR